MKSLLTLMLAVVIALSFSVAGFATVSQTKASAVSQTTVTEKKTEPTERTMTYTGRVVSVNDTDHTMVVKGRQGEKTFDVSNVNEKVQPGHDVTVTYHNENGMMVASSVSGVTHGVKTSVNRLGHKITGRGYNGNIYAYNGKVAWFDRANHKMIVKGLIREKMFDVSHAAINGAVKPGERVHVTYYKERGKAVASSVAIG